MALVVAPRHLRLLRSGICTITEFFSGRICVLPHGRSDKGHNPSIKRTLKTAENSRNHLFQFLVTNQKTVSLSSLLNCEVFQPFMFGYKATIKAEPIDLSSFWAD